MFATSFTSKSGSNRFLRSHSDPDINRRFSSTDLRRLFSCLVVSIAVCSEMMSIYPRVDTSRCVHKGHHPYSHLFCPNGGNQTLTVLRKHQFALSLRLHRVAGPPISNPKEYVAEKLTAVSPYRLHSLWFRRLVVFDFTQLWPPSRERYVNRILRNVIAMARLAEARGVQLKNSRPLSLRRRSRAESRQSACAAHSVVRVSR
jgi:hypothetical protein